MKFVYPTMTLFMAMIVEKTLIRTRTYLGRDNFPRIFYVCDKDDMVGKEVGKGKFYCRTHLLLIDLFDIKYII